MTAKAFPVSAVTGRRVAPGDPDPWVWVCPHCGVVYEDPVDARTCGVLGDVRGTEPAAPQHPPDGPDSPAPPPAAQPPPAAPQTEPQPPPAPGGVQLPPEAPTWLG